VLFGTYQRRPPARCSSGPSLHPRPRPRVNRFRAARAAYMLAVLASVMQKRTSGARRGAGSYSGSTVRWAADREKRGGRSNVHSAISTRATWRSSARITRCSSGAGCAWLVWAFVHSLCLPQLQNRLRAATPVDLVVFHRPAQLAPHPRTAADHFIEPPYCATLTDRVVPWGRKMS